MYYINIVYINVKFGYVTFDFQRKLIKNNLKISKLRVTFILTNDKNIFKENNDTESIITFFYKLQFTSKRIFFYKGQLHWVVEFKFNCLLKYIRHSTRIRERNKQKLNYEQRMSLIIFLNQNLLSYYV